MTETQTKPVGPEFSIQRIYTKDLSFEAPTTPHVFREAFQHEVNLQVNTFDQKLEEGSYEVVLHATVTASQKGKVAFLIEIKQAGIFTFKNFTEDHLKYAINALAPSILFPYVREVVSEMVSRGTFPQLILAPLNFEAMYMQKNQTPVTTQ